MTIFKPGDRIYLRDKSHYIELAYALNSHKVKYSLHKDRIGKYLQIERPEYNKPVLWIEDSLIHRIWHFFGSLLHK